MIGKGCGSTAGDAVVEQGLCSEVKYWYWFWGIPLAKVKVVFRLGLIGA